jgi:hypothetical protein
MVDSYNLIITVFTNFPIIFKLVTDPDPNPEVYSDQYGKESYVFLFFKFIVLAMFISEKALAVLLDRVQIRVNKLQGEC